MPQLAPVCSPSGETLPLQPTPILALLQPLQEPLDAAHHPCLRAGCDQLTPSSPQPLHDPVFFAFSEKVFCAGGGFLIPYPQLEKNDWLFGGLDFGYYRLSGGVVHWIDGTLRVVVHVLYKFESRDGTSQHVAEHRNTSVGGEVKFTAESAGIFGAAFVGFTSSSSSSESSSLHDPLHSDLACCVLGLAEDSESSLSYFFVPVPCDKLHQHRPIKSPLALPRCCPAAPATPPRRAWTSPGDRPTPTRRLSTSTPRLC